MTGTTETFANLPGATARFYAICGPMTTARYYSVLAGFLGVWWYALWIILSRWGLSVEDSVRLLGNETGTHWVAATA